MAFGKKKDKEELTTGSLSKEFFGDGSGATASNEPAQSASVPGASEQGAVPGKEDAANAGDNYSLFNNKKEKADLGPDYSKKSWLQFGADDNAALNPYAAEQDKRYKMDPRAYKIVRLVVLSVVGYLLFALIMPSPVYDISFDYTVSAFLTCIQTNIAQLGIMFDPNSGAILPFKLRSYAIAMFAGAALAITGAVYQGSLKNALASPTTLGINAGGTLGVSIFVLLATPAMLNPFFASGSGSVGVADIASYYNSLSVVDYLAATQWRAFAALIGCFVAVGLVMLVSHLIGGGNSSSFALIICGQVVAAVASSAAECIRYYVIQTDTTGVKNELIQSAQMGEINPMATTLDLLLVAIPIIIGVTAIILLRRKLNILAFNDEEARSMGMATQRLRWAMVLLCTFVTAIVVSFCGNIAFVGFAIPLIVRRYVGPDFNYLIPGSVAMGALFMVCACWLTDFNIPYLFGLEIPMSVSMLTSMIGAVLFAVITIKQRRAGRSADWI